MPADTWGAGEHEYYFEMAYSVPAPGGGGTNPIPPRPFTVDATTAMFDGRVVLRPAGLRARIGEDCEAAIEPPIINPGQRTRFVCGWVTDTPMTYEEAMAQFAIMSVSVHWDGGPAVEMVGPPIVPGSRFGALVCSMTE